MNKRIGICEWSVKYKDEELFQWMKVHNIGNLSVDFQYDLCKDEKSREEWIEHYKTLSEKYDIALSILAVNVLCTYGMNHAELEDKVKDILDTAISAAAALGTPAVHLPSFGEGTIKSRKELDQVIRILQYACELGERFQIQIGYECPLDAKDLGYVLQRVHSETFYMLFDNENVSLLGIDPVELYEKYAGYYKHTHLKTASAESYIRPLEQEAGFGGILPLAETMKKHGFNGWIISETDYHKEKDTDKMNDIVDRDVSFLQKIFM